MKSVPALGIGVIALTAGAFITAGAAAGGKTESRHDAVFVLRGLGGGRDECQAGRRCGVRGRGRQASGVAAFSISLGGQGSSGAILFTSLDGRMPAPGRYELSDSANTGFRALYVAGSAEHPTGLFRAERGTLEITASGRDHISGHFCFTGAGFQATIQRTRARR